jgi:DNA polymerase I-like protein with 3'-5' exonuclease and polymerase domains
MSWKKLMDVINKEAEETGVSINAAQAKKLIEKYRQLHPGLAVWWNDVAATLTRTHTIRTQLGRRRVFYDRPEAILPDAIAYNPQGTVAKALNLGLLAAFHDPTLKQLGFEILLQVHDAIGYQGPLGTEDAINTRLVECMRVAIPIARRSIEPYTIEIPVEIKTGLNWGDRTDTNPEGLHTWHPQ